MNTISETYESLNDVFDNAIKDAKRGFTVEVIVKDNNAVLSAIKKLLALDYEFALINIDTIDYFGEYCVTFDLGNVWVEQVWHYKDGKDVCYSFEGDIAYVTSDCDDEVFTKLHSKTITKFTIS